MSEFDGEIRINTKINTADAEKMLMKLEEKMQQSAKQCEKIHLTHTSNLDITK